MIYVTTLTMTERWGWVNPHLAEWLAALRDPRAVYHPTHNFGSHEIARNAAAEACLKDGIYSHLLMIDNDIIPKWFGNRMVNLLELAELDLDVVAAPVPIFRKSRLCLNVYRQDERAGNNSYRTLTQQEVEAAAKRRNILEVDAVGTGAICIRREVLRQIAAEQPPFLTYRGADGSIRRSEDITFCEAARTFGFKIHASYLHICGHAKTLNLLDMFVTRSEVEQAHEKMKNKAATESPSAGSR